MKLSRIFGLLSTDRLPTTPSVSGISWSKSHLSVLRRIMSGATVGIKVRTQQLSKHESGYHFQSGCWAHLRVHHWGIRLTPPYSKNPHLCQTDCDTDDDCVCVSDALSEPLTCSTWTVPRHPHWSVFDLLGSFIHSNTCFGTNIKTILFTIPHFQSLFVTKQKMFLTSKQQMLFKHLS